MEGKFVNLSNSWFRNGEKESMVNTYGAEGLLVYSLIMRNLTYRNEFIFSINYLAERLNIQQNNTRMVTKIKTGLNRINNKLVTIYNNSDFNEKVVKFEFGKIYYGVPIIDIPKEKYFKAYDKEIDTLLEYLSDKKINKFDICTYLLFLLACMGNKEGEENYKICYPSHEYISKLCNIEINEIVRYNKILEDLKLIAIDNAGMNKTEDNQFSNVSNTYSRYEDKNILEEVVEKQRQKVSIAIDYTSKKLLQNNSRSKAKEISIWRTQNDIYDLTLGEYNELYDLEKEHYDIRHKICDSKIHINGGYITLYCTKGGAKKEYEQYKEYNAI